MLNKIYCERRIAGNLLDSSKEKSLFLFGPRQTGKTSLLKKLFPVAPFYNLLLSDVFFRLSQRPQLIREEVFAGKIDHGKPIIIDEIQKLPVLLDEVHYLIEEKGCRFILTGSSSRKLRRGGANLLGGRAWTRQLFPLVSCEINGFDLSRVLNFGAIPSVYYSSSPREDLEWYAGNYLKEEIQEERLVRKIENFSRFLQSAALYSAQLINFSNVASDSGIPARTVAEYFSILEETLIGNLLPAFTKTHYRKAVTTGKFYFFDVGVANFLAGRENIRPKTELYGHVLEQFIFTEIKAFLHYSRDARVLSFWRSKSGYEVDFMIGDETAIEVKSADLVTEKHCAGLKAISQDLTLKRKVIVSLDSLPRRIGDIHVFPVDVFLKMLWAGKF